MAYTYLLYTAFHAAEGGRYTETMEAAFSSKSKAEAAKKRLETSLTENDNYRWLTDTVINGHGNAGLGRVLRHPDGDTYTIFIRQVELNYTGW